MRLIDADALINTLKELFDKREKEARFTGDRGVTVTWKDAIYHIKTAPTIESKTGKWIPVTKIYKVTEGQFPKTHIEWVDATEPDEIDGVRCSECGTVYDFIEARNWCSECGADMRGNE